MMREKSESEDHLKGQLTVLLQEAVYGTGSHEKVEFNHKFNWNGQQIVSECNVRLWTLKDQGTQRTVVFVLFTDLNKGASVTNASGQLVQEIWEQKLRPIGLDRSKVLFAETYAEMEKEDVDQVIPVWDGDKVTSVTWRHIGTLIRS